MTDFELLQDINLLLQYIQHMKDVEKMDELNKYHSMAKKKLDEVYKDKKKILKQR